MPLCIQFFISLDEFSPLRIHFVTGGGWKTIPRRGQSTYDRSAGSKYEMPQCGCSERGISRPGLFRKGFSASGIKDSPRSSTHKWTFSGGPVLMFVSVLPESSRLHHVSQPKWYESTVNGQEVKHTCSPIFSNPWYCQIPLGATVQTVWSSSHWKHRHLDTLSAAAAQGKSVSFIKQ